MTVTIHTNLGARKIRATAFGDLCIHPMIGDLGMWTVTHVGTGYRILDRKDRAEAAFIADKLSALKIWKLVRPNAAKSRAPPQVRKALKDIQAAWDLKKATAKK